MIKKKKGLKGYLGRDGRETILGAVINTKEKGQVGCLKLGPPSLPLFGNRS